MSQAGVPCSVCFDLDYRRRPEKWEGEESRYQRMIKVIQLREGADRGCRVCSIVNEGIDACKEGLDPIGIESTILLVCKPSFPLQVGVAEYKDAGSKWVDFFVEEGNSSPWPAFGQSKVVPERLTVEIATKQATKWLHDCEHKHKHDPCPHEDFTGLPTRVLDLGEIPSPEDPIKLVHSGGIEAKYMSLSHCWGSVQFLTTTRDTIEQRKAGIPLKDLPQTFRDAVALTRSLGIRYLWIDSLCIIQKDHDDWEFEAGRMKSVYANSYLNIAATGSSAGSGGCFRQRVLLTAGPRARFSVVRTHQIHRSYLGASIIYARLSLNSAHDALGKRGLLSGQASQLAPLLSRAWVYQERVIAPRTIHFHGTEMMWECISSSRCECGGLDRHPIDLFRSQITDTDDIDDIHGQWCFAVQQYSGLDATYASDKFPAFSGIADYFNAKLKCEYLAGLWRKHILRGLQWVVTDGNKACRRLPYQAPTWSWASLNSMSAKDDKHYGVRVTYQRTKNIQIDCDLAILSAHVQPLSNNLYGSIAEGAFIVLRAAFLIPLKVELAIECWEEFGLEEIRLVINLEGTVNPIYLEPDIAINPMSDVQRRALCKASMMRFILLGTEKSKQDDPNCHTYGMLLRECDGFKGVYERVGLVNFPLPFAVRRSMQTRVSTFKII